MKRNQPSESFENRQVHEVFFSSYECRLFSRRQPRYNGNNLCYIYNAPLIAVTQYSDCLLARTGFRFRTGNPGDEAAVA
jgi:hypothetical protein